MIEVFKQQTSVMTFSQKSAGSLHTNFNISIDIEVATKSF
jgi:hypothetical protein